jgi:ParB-like chromosome segregation protein Spo0J
LIHKILGCIAANRCGRSPISIASFGFNAPLLIDAEQSVIAGHGRVLAAKALGWTEVPVVAIENLDAAQRRAFAIADNRLTENSTWDDRLLAEQLQGAINPRSQFRS